MADGLCDLSFDGDYEGGNDFYREVPRVARKTHRCVECRKDITPGQRYVYISGMNDGHIWTTKMCQPCFDILHEFTTGSWSFGELWENFQSEWSHGTPLQPCLNRVSTVAAKEKLRDQWLQYKGIATS